MIRFTNHICSIISFLYGKKGKEKMNKLFSKIAAASVGLAMAVGVGVVLGHKAEARAVRAETEDVIYTIGNYPAGTQYADEESHVLDAVLTLVSNDCHFTSELRMYQDGGGSGAVVDNWAKLVSSKKIAGLKINVNCNTKGQTSTLVLTGSNDGINFTNIDSKSTGTGSSYSDVTFSFAADTSYTTLKLKNSGSYQSRVKTITVTYVKEAVVVSEVNVSGSESITSGYLGFKNVAYSADVVYSTGQGDESVTWSTNSVNNTISSNGVLHITANETTIITATSQEDPTVSGSITVTISGLVSKSLTTSSVTVNTDTFGSSNIVSESAGTPAVVEAGNLRFSIDKGESTSNPGYYASSPVSLRIYTGASITVSTLDGSAIYFASLKSISAGNQMAATMVSLSTGVVSIDENGIAMIDLSAAPVSSFTMSVTAQVRIDSASCYTFAQSAAEAVQSFIDNYMHMDEDVEGQCLTLYAPAKAAFNAMSAEARELFATDATYKAAYDRLVAWAAAHGEELNSSNVLALNPEFVDASNNGSTIIIIIAATFAVTTFGAILLIRKKKHSK